jgi:acyl carrier protein
MDKQYLIPPFQKIFFLQRISLNNNYKKYFTLLWKIYKNQKVFIESLIIDSKKFNQKLKYNEIPEWDSIGHMTLISNLETTFKISIGNDDVLDFSSFKKGMQIFKKYKIN